MEKIINSLDHPIKQAVLLLMVSLMTQLLVLVFHHAEAGSDFSHWIISSSILLLYAFFNSVYLLKTPDTGVYIRRSIYGFLLLLITGFGFALAFSDLIAADQRSVRWIFFMIIFSYFIFLTIAYFMRKIIEYAQRQDTES